MKVENTQAGQKVILLLDDDPAHRALERRAICGSFPEIEIIEAGSIDDALRSARERASRLCLAVVDFNLDGECGADAIRALKSIPGLTSISFMVVSTSAMQNDIKISLEAGAEAYLVKSSDPVKFQQDLAVEVARFVKTHGI